VGIGWLYANGAGSPGSGAIVTTSLQAWVIKSGIFSTLTAVLVILIAHVVNTIERQSAELAQTLEQLENTQTALTEAKRIEGLGRLAAGIAHDFNNTLHVVMSWASILEESQDQKARHDGIAAIQSAAEKAGGLTAKLLALGGNRIQKPTTTYPRFILEELGRSTSNILPKDIILQFELVDTPPVFVDPAELEQLVLNLVINARDAMPNGGRLTIGLGLEKKALRPTSSQKSLIHIWVTDTGLGMDQFTLESIFDPFFTTKGDLGTGLGLSSAYAFAEASGGLLEAESEPLVGTTVHLYLPITHLKDLQVDPLQNHRSIQGRRILYAEDDEMIRPVMETAFRAAGVDVVLVSSFDAALRSLEIEEEPFDLLYLDASEPNKYTNQLIDKFRLHSPNARILLTSGQLPDPHMRRAITLGKIEYIRKPYQPAALIEKATSLLQELPSSTQA